MKTKMLSVLTFTALSIVVGCKKDKNEVATPPVATNESEVITTLKLVFDDTTAANMDVVAVFDDQDGDGGNTPIQHDTIKLLANKIYHTTIYLLDKTKNPIDTISNEVKEEANDHHFFFNYSGVSVTSTYLDLDSNNPPLPLGLITRWVTGNASVGTSQIILKHQPGTKNGTQTPGETDIDVVFQTKIQ